MDSSFQIFDRKRKHQQRVRCAKNFARYDFLIREAGERLAERLDDVARKFPTTLVMGSYGGLLTPMLQGRGGIETIIECDSVSGFLPPSQTIVQCNEELLPFADDSLDAVISLFTLQWVNDLPGTLVQIRRMLKPDGLFLALFPGGESLKELRHAVTEAAIATESGLSPRVSPFVDVRDAGMLLQRAGFALPVVDSQMLTVTYANALKLMDDLRGMGESNALLKRQSHFTSRSQLMAITEQYHKHFAGDDGRIPATFELLTLTGWKPHASQPLAAKRGSGTVSLTTILKD